MKTLTASDGSKMELGPRSIRPVGPAGYNTLCLIEDLNIQNEIIHVKHSEPAAQNRFIYANNQLNRLPSKPMSVFTRQAPFAKPLAFYGLHDLFTKQGSLQDESVYDFISRRFDEDLARYAIDPMCRGIFAGDCRKISVVSCFPPLHEAEKIGGSLLKGMIIKTRKRTPHQRKCSLNDKVKSERWSTYSFKQGLQYLSYSVTKYLSSQPEIELIKKSPCSRISFENGKAKILVNGDTITADHVVSSIYAADLGKLLQPEFSEMSACLASVPAVDTVVVCLEFDGRVQPPTKGIENNFYF